MLISWVDVQTTEKYLRMMKRKEANQSSYGKRKRTEYASTTNIVEGKSSCANENSPVDCGNDNVN